MYFDLSHKYVVFLHNFSIQYGLLLLSLANKNNLVKMYYIYANYY